MKAIKTLMKYLFWPGVIIGFTIGIIFMYNTNANRQALYDVKEYCYGEDCIGFKQLYNDMNKICNHTMEGTVYYDGGCVGEDDVEECIANEGYLSCIKKKFEEKETGYYDMQTGKSEKIYQRNSITDYITNIKNSNIAGSERITKLAEENRNLTSELSTVKRDTNITALYIWNITIDETINWSDER